MIRHNSAQNVPFFNLGVAHTLHYISLTLEIVGLLLAILEIWYHDKARSWEATIEKFGSSPFKVLWSILHEKVGGGNAGILTTPGAISGLIAMAGGAWFGYKTGSWTTGLLAFLAFVPCIIILEFTILAIAWGLVRIFRAMGIGKALGGIGITLGFAGVLIGIYQVITVHIS
jgi:hypothetical protein